MAEYPRAELREFETPPQKAMWDKKVPPLSEHPILANLAREAEPTPAMLRNCAKCIQGIPHSEAVHEAMRQE